MVGSQEKVSQARQHLGGEAGKRRNAPSETARTSRLQHDPCSIPKGTIVSDSDFLLFALEGSRPLAEKVGLCLNVPLSPHEERNFEDGEHKTRPLVNVRNRHVFVLHSLYGEPGA